MFKALIAPILSRYTAVSNVQPMFERAQAMAGLDPRQAQEIRRAAAAMLSVVAN